MFSRVCIIVLDSVGIGALPDAVEYGDVGAHTLGNIYAARGKKLEIPNLLQLGLGNIEDSRLPSVAEPMASYGRMAELTRAKDTTSGHWEMMGLITDPPFVVLEKFPDEFLAEWLKENGRPPKWLGNLPASGTEIIDRLGEEHVKTGAPIVYTSADSVFQIAAHEDIIPLPELYKLCETARKKLIGDLFVGRVIARPFMGKPGAFRRTENRKDYAIPPTGKTILDALQENGQTTLGIGKIEDIFCNRGVANANHTKNNSDGIAATMEALETNSEDTIIFTNLVDFDMQYGHRNDPEGYASALEAFDRALPLILASLRLDDLLIITADHGCDPTTASTDHSREYVPILMYQKNAPATALGTRKTFADIAATIYEGLGYGEWGIGTAF
ncbi:MAG: phosphopentomutase [Defluviitaleaceae bacterium]|nr:phosphopentomutase [Defluviitaleaceae bacterium]